jgi:hypothetical protein
MQLYPLNSAIEVCSYHRLRFGVTEHGLFSGDRIRELLTEVADLMTPGPPQSTVLLVGGSLLAWHGLRPSTKDVDTSVLIDEELRASVRVVAERHQLAVDWLNDHSVPWHPQTLRNEHCDVLIDRPRLRVLGAPLPSVFLMKLNRSQPQDMLDMITLWPHVAEVFPTARVVTDAFYAAFPGEDSDEFLGQQVVDIAQRAGWTLPLR